MNSETIDAKRLIFSDNLKQLKIEVKPSTMLSNGRSLDPEDLDFIIKVHEFLQDRFSRNLAMFRHRSPR